MPKTHDPAILSLMRAFLWRSRADVDAMRQALGRADLEAIDRLAHRMLGAAGVFGLDDIVAPARELSRLARARAPALDAVVERLSRAVEDERQAHPLSRDLTR